MSNQISIEEALKSAVDTKSLAIGEGILTRSAEIFIKEFPGSSKVAIVADNNTFRAAGREVVDIFTAKKINQEEPFIFSDPNLYADYKYVENLIDFLNKTEAIPIAVGSGVINDIVKLASSKTNRRYFCIASAASMDGYTAYGASMTIDGKKQTVSCPAPKACLVDINVIRNAPKELTASGYGDLFAKIPAGADWILADALGEEKIDVKAWNIVQGSLHNSLSDPRGLAAGDKKPVSDLITGLIMGGFAMQYYRSSRPASGAEHQFSHLWSMEHLKYKGRDISHGFQAAVGTIAVSALYESLLRFPVEKIDIERAVKIWKTKEDFMTLAQEIFKDTDFKDLCIAESAAKWIEPSRLKIQLQTFKDSWGILKKKIAEQLLPVDEIKKRFEIIGTPYKPAHIGIDEAYLKRSFLRAFFIRRRFTVLDLCLRAGILDEIAENLKF
ncbi:MAG: sn-glycerol-1-phosphate dehydrogenase [Elusimicrobiota bacterium]|jgi:glycerol-1-phosphate dehydrogenase [NAD(P)+]|nr:sn-glycerol-1-phosphate dehydrogenase [Elusimicrobiota bacterium]